MKSFLLVSLGIILLVSVFKMQLRSGRSLNAHPVNAHPVPVYKPNPSDIVSSYKPLSSSEHIVRYIFTLLDKYNNILKDNNTKYRQSCDNVPIDNRENVIKNLEHMVIVENARIRTEMISIINENFDIISHTLPPFMLYGMVMDARHDYDIFNAYKCEFANITWQYDINGNTKDTTRTLNVFLDEIDKLDEKFTAFIVGSYAQSHLYTF